MIAWPIPPSREARDTLFMLGVIAWTMAPHLPGLPLWVAVLALGVLVWRARLAWTERALPGRWALVTLVAVTVGMTFWTERTLIGRQAGVTLLVVLMAAKTMELRARRDALVVFFLGFFLVLTNFLNSQSLLTAIGMTLSVWGWLTALTLAHMPAGQPRIAAAAKLAARAAAWGTPLMLVLFMLFPRIGPLWTLPQDGGRTGLSDHLQFGDVAHLAQDDSIVMRVRFQDTVPSLSQLYFRGPTLSDYDGERWQAVPIGPALREAPEAAHPIRYDMTVEPHGQQWLTLLDFPTAIPQAIDPPPGIGNAGPDRAGQWRLLEPLRQRVRIIGQAGPRPAATSALSPRQRHMLTALPDGRHPRTRAWAAALQASLPPGPQRAKAVAERVLNTIRDEAFTYTLQPGAYLNDPVDEFWLDRRAGFCEHYAGSFAVIMRALGIPARLVTGYQGADTATQDGYWVVRQLHAHAWVEIWDEDLGWLRTDPTAAVAPSRVQQGQAFTPPPGLVGGAMDAVGPGLRLSVQRWLERVDNRWNQWILGYGKSQQHDWLRDWGWEDVNPWGLLRLLIVLVASAGLLGAAWAWWDARRLPVWQRFMVDAHRLLKARGIATEPQDDLAMLAHRLAQHPAATATTAQSALNALHEARYGRSEGQAHNASETSLRRTALRAIRALPRLKGVG